MRRSIDSRVVRSTSAWVYPAGIGKHGAVDVAEVAMACPPLLSIRAMEDLGVVLNFGRRTIEIEKASV